MPSLGFYSLIMVIVAAISVLPLPCFAFATSDIPSQMFATAVMLAWSWESPWYQPQQWGQMVNSLYIIMARMVCVSALWRGTFLACYCQQLRLGQLIVDVGLYEQEGQAFLIFGGTDVRMTYCPRLCSLVC